MKRPEEKSKDTGWQTPAGVALEKIRAHETLGNTVYAAISDGLIRGQFKAGDRIRIRELADFLGTSVTPVRDAVLRLIHDEALTMKSARDIRVPVLTADEYLEIRDIRLQLEGMAAERAATSASPEAVEWIEQLLAEHEAALEGRDMETAIACNQRFHFILPAIADMPVLQRVLHLLWMKMGPLISSAYEQSGREMIEEHYKVLEAMRAQDGEAAAEAIRRDILRGGSTILRRLELSSS